MTKPILMLALAILVAAAMAACSPGIDKGIGHRITFDDTGMVLHASGKPDAHVAADGSLRMGDRTIAVTPAQRVLLQQYYQQAKLAVKAGGAVGTASAKLGQNVIGNLVRSIFHGDSKAAEGQMETQSNKIQAAVAGLCTSLHAMDATRKAISAQIPEFMPYATVTDQMHCNVTTTASSATTGGGAPSASTSIKTDQQATAH